METTKKLTCNCLIRHALTETERTDVKKRIDYARKVGDGTGVMIGLAALSPCPAAA